MAHHKVQEGPIKFGGKGYYEPLPVDFLILERMPDQGMVGGIHWRGVRAKDVRDSINQGVDTDLRVESPLIQSRLRAMSTAGLVKGYPAAASGERIWARLPLGIRLMEEKEAYLG